MLTVLYSQGALDLSRYVYLSEEIKMSCVSILNELIIVGGVRLYRRAIFMPGSLLAGFYSDARDQE